jgi:hypothetical protein
MRKYNINHNKPKRKIFSSAKYRFAALCSMDFLKSALRWIWTLETPSHDRWQLAMPFDKIVE